ncbi:hypothetical protein MVEN_00157600 [Mycena venus]|uniref:GATA-type domain-containing protein n=1 Tax=Mycena venus TaxID=2733690 RepID=A0A8H6Z2Z6_9AGAR|nr:hypothetical protein MVEN_00157600 [Mycena venus]
MSQNYQNWSPDEWTSSGHTPIPASNPFPTHDDSSDAPTVYNEDAPLVAFGNVPQEAPMLNPAQLDATFIPVYQPAAGFLPSSVPQPQPFQNSPPSPSYPIHPTGGWPLALPQQAPYAFSGPTMLPSSSSSYHDTQIPHLSPPTTQPYPPVLPHAQIQLTEISEEQRASGSSKECSHCHVKSTPVWRREPRTHQTLCNACGLYLAQHQQLRPRSLIDVDNEGTAEGGDTEAEYAYEGPECRNCGTRKTSTWRRNKAGEQR